jgi:hypothetical protein
MPKKKFVCLLLFEGTFRSVFKDKKSHKEVTKQQKSRFFLLFLLLDGARGPDLDQDPYK